MAVVAITGCEPSLHTPPPPPLPQITHLEARTDLGFVQLQWHGIGADRTSAAVTYELWRSVPITSPTDTSEPASYRVEYIPQAELLAATTITSYVDGTIAPDTVALYSVRARDAYRSGAFSDPLWLRTPALGAAQSHFTLTPSDPTSSTQATFFFEGSGALQFECSLDGNAWEPCSSPWTVSVAEGAHTLDLRAIGLRGIKELQPSRWRWTVDRSAPQLRIVAEPDLLSRSSPVTAEFDASDQLTPSHMLRYLCSLDNTDAYDCTSPLVMDNLSEGLHTLHIQAVDQAGNRSRPAELTWQMDLPPETLLGYRPAALTPITTAVFTLGTSDPLPGGYNCVLDDAAIACAASFSVPVTPGTHTLVVQAYDINGTDDPTPLTYQWQVTSDALWATALTVAVGEEHLCAIDAETRLWCAGSTTFGQSGTQAIDHTSGAGYASTATGWSAVAVGRYHSCAIRLGALYCWGWNILGQLGTGGAVSDSAIPLQVGSANTWIGVASGDWHSCAWRQDLSAYCWGANASGQLGSGDTQTRTTPTLIAGESYVYMAAGGQSSCGLTASGAMRCFGANNAGQLGLGHTDNVSLPSTMAGGSWPATWLAVYPGSEHACGLHGTEMWCWGAGDQGQTGAGTMANTLQPVHVAGTDARTYSHSAGHTACQILNSGNLECWGAGTFGQLGDGWSSNQSLPEPAGLDSRWSAVATGNLFSCGIRAADSDAGPTVWCWGTTPFGLYTSPVGLLSAP